MTQRDIEDRQLQEQLKQHRMQMELAQVNRVRRWAIGLWLVSLAVVTFVWVAASLLQSEPLGQAGMALLIPAITGGIVHGVYHGRADELERKLRGGTGRRWTSPPRSTGGAPGRSSTASSASGPRPARCAGRTCPRSTGRSGGR